MICGVEIEDILYLEVDFVRKCIYRRIRRCRIYSNARNVAMKQLPHRDVAFRFYKYTDAGFAFFVYFVIITLLSVGNCLYREFL